MLDMQTRQKIAALSEGMSAGVVSALAEAADRVNGQISGRASIRSGLISRAFSVQTGQATQRTVRLGQPFICTMLTGRGLFPNVLDDSSLVTLRAESPSQVGFLLGDPDEDLNLATLNEISTPWPLAKPWLIWPVEELRLTCTGASTLASTSRVVLSFSGFYLQGFGAGGG